MHPGGHYCSRVGLLTSKGAEKSTVVSAVDCKVEADSLTVIMCLSRDFST